MSGARARTGPGAAAPRLCRSRSVPRVTFSNRITAKLAIAEALGMPLARLSEEERAFIDGVLAETLERRMVMERVMARLRPARGNPC